MTSGIINLMNIILLLSILISSTMSPASQNEDSVYFLATALFMVDAQGKYVLLDRSLPVSIEEVIKEDVLSHLESTLRNKAIIKVVPKPAHLQPFEFPRNTMRLDLRKMASRKNFLDTIKTGLTNFWDYDIMRKGGGKTKKKINLTKFVNPNPDTTTSKAENVEQFTVTQETKLFDQTEKAIQLDVPEKVEPLSEDKSLLVKKPIVKIDQSSNYIPNDIYYSIEKKCVNWSEGCQLKSPPLFDQPASSFKFSPRVPVPPRFQLWDP